MDTPIPRVYYKTDRRQAENQPKNGRIPHTKAAKTAWDVWVFFCALVLGGYLLRSSLAQGLDQPSVPEAFPGVATNITKWFIWDPSPTTSVTNYQVVISNKFGISLFNTNGTNLSFTFAEPTPSVVSVYAQNNGGISVPISTNLWFIPVIIWRVYAQTGGLTGFQDWKLVDSLTNGTTTNQLFLKLRAEQSEQ